ncbi:hypothetical protein GALL_501970 [mine drainage metagenome]|uniref:Uncharacterized protein n=1 Tax=mine drainage metagenome TaxID=410659 RepID=A0A1J5PA87_9ZZZZ
MQKRKRVDLDRVVDDELHPRKTDAIGGQPPPTGCSRGVGHVQHDLGARVGHLVQWDFLHVIVSHAFVHIAGLALGAGYGDILIVVQQMRGVSSADHRRQAKLSADDRGVAGAATVVCDDRRGALHDRNPIGVRRRGDKDGAVDKAPDVMGALDD